MSLSMPITSFILAGAGFEPAGSSNQPRQLSVVTCARHRLASPACFVLVASSPMDAALSITGAGVEPANRSGYPINDRITTNPVTISKMARLAMSSASKRQLVFFTHLLCPVWTARCTFFISVSPRLKKKNPLLRCCSGFRLDALIKKHRFNIAKNPCSLRCLL